MKIRKNSINIIRVLSLLMTFIICFALCACNDSDDYEEVISEIVIEDGSDNNDVGNTDSTDKAGTKGSTKTKTTKKNSSSNLESGSLKGKTIKMFFWEDLKNSIYKDAIAKFESTTGAKLVTEIGSHNDYFTLLSAKIASGKSPDLVQAYENNMYVVKNLQPLNNFSFNASDTKWDKSVVNDFTFNGKTYATAVNKSPNNNLAVIYYNKKALKKAGMTSQDPYTIWKNNPSDWTWNKVWDMCEKFVKANRNREGYYGITFGVEELYCRAFGVSFNGYNPASGKWENYIKNPETVNRYQILVDNISKKNATATCDYNAFMMGNILFSCTYSSMMESGRTDMNGLGIDNVGIVPIPTDSKKTPIFTYCAYGIPVGSTNGDAALEFISYVFSQDNLEMDKFYRTAQAKEVINFTINRGNYFFANGYQYDVWQKLSNSDAGQVKSILDAYSGEVDSFVDESNKTISSLK